MNSILCLHSSVSIMANLIYIIALTTHKDHAYMSLNYSSCKFNHLPNKQSRQNTLSTRNRENCLCVHNININLHID